jgi:hypothetical protein
MCTNVSARGYSPVLGPGFAGDASVAVAIVAGVTFTALDLADAVVPSPVFSVYEVNSDEQLGGTKGRRQKRGGKRKKIQHSFVNSSIFTYGCHDLDGAKCSVRVRWLWWRWQGGEWRGHPSHT